MKKKLLLTICLFSIMGYLCSVNAEMVQYSINVTSGTSSHDDNNEYQTDSNNTNQMYTSDSPIKARDYIQTTNLTNLNVKFMYYIPKNLVNSTKPFPVIVYVPGLDGDGEDCLRQEVYDFADTNGFGILTPSFKYNEEDFRNNKAYQYPNVWSGNALIRMLKKAQLKGLNYSKIYLMGFSAGAQFTSRFSLLYPDMVQACAFMASGAKVVPTSRTNVKYFVGIGSMDDKLRLDNAQAFYNEARKLGISVEYKTYPIGHEESDQEISDVLNFFKRVKNSSF